MRAWIAGAAVAATVAFAGQARAEDKNKESSAQIEIAPAAERQMPGGQSGFGPSAAIEFTAIEDVLEIELGVSPLFGGGQTQWGTELTFQTPLISFDNVEVSFAIGPEWQRQTGHGETDDSVGATAALDFEIWRLPERKYGWFVEPSYGYSFGSDHQRSLGLAAGWIFAIP